MYDITFCHSLHSTARLWHQITRVLCERDPGLLSSFFSVTGYPISNSGYVSGMKYTLPSQTQQIEFVMCYNSNFSCGANNIPIHEENNGWKLAVLLFNSIFSVIYAVKKHKESSGTLYNDRDLFVCKDFNSLNIARNSVVNGFCHNIHYVFYLVIIKFWLVSV